MEQKTSFVDFYKKAKRKVVTFVVNRYWNIRAGVRKTKWFFVRKFRATRRFL